MSDEANVTESSGEQPVSEGRTVSDAMEARDPAEMGLSDPIIEAGPLVPAEAVVVSEEDRKRDIKRNMAANYRDKVARRDALRKEGVKTLETGVNPNRSEAPPEGSSGPAE